jgi:hypothetical protein
MHRKGTAIHRAERLQRAAGQSCMAPGKRAFRGVIAHSSGEILHSNGVIWLPAA